MKEISEEVTLEGHIIDSWTLPKVFDAVMDLGGSFDLEEIRVGRKKDETSFARLKVMAASETQLDSILTALQQFGAVLVSRMTFTRNRRHAMGRCRTASIRRRTCRRKCG